MWAVASRSCACVSRGGQGVVRQGLVADSLPPGFVSLGIGRLIRGALGVSVASGALSGPLVPRDRRDGALAEATPSINRGGSPSSGMPPFVKALWRVSVALVFAPSGRVHVDTKRHRLRPLGLVWLRQKCELVRMCACRAHVRMQCPCLAQVCTVCLEGRGCVQARATAWHVSSGSANPRDRFAPERLWAKRSGLALVIGVVALRMPLRCGGVARCWVTKRPTPCVCEICGGEPHLVPFVRAAVRDPFWFHGPGRAAPIALGGVPLRSYHRSCILQSMLWRWVARCARSCAAARPGRCQAGPVGPIG